PAVLPWPASPPAVFVTWVMASAWLSVPAEPLPSRTGSPVVASTLAIGAMAAAATAPTPPSAAARILRREAGAVVSIAIEWDPLRSPRGMERDRVQPRARAVHIACR